MIAGETVRAVMTSAGVQNVLTKSLGSANPHNVIKATFDALIQLRNKAEVAALRGKTVEEICNPWQADKKLSKEAMAQAGEPAASKIKLQYYRSKICTPVKHKLVIKGLGFTRLNQIVEREDTPSIRGMVAKVPHLVRVVE